MDSDVPITYPHSPFVEAVHPMENGWQATAACTVDGYPGRAELVIDTSKYGHHHAHVRYFNGVEWVRVLDLHNTEVIHHVNEMGANPTAWAGQYLQELWYDADKIVKMARLRNDAVDAEAEFKKRAFCALDEADKIVPLPAHITPNTLNEEHS